MSRRARTLVYCLVVTVIAGAVYFPFLSLHPISGDEPQYALCTDYIHQTGNWLSPTPYPPDPYFQKPPLYMWLSAATYNFFGQSFAKYRFWSALFGTLTIPGTCYLGALLLNPEIGLIAALLLMSNDDYARNHGVLTGTFDTGLTLACLACFILYYLWSRCRLRWPAWIAIGVIAGLASLFKPAFGLLPILLLAIHAIAINRTHPLRARIKVSVLALVVAAIVCSWWYAAEYHRFGSRYTAALRETTVHRISQGLSPHHVKAVTYYPIRISQSSFAFILFVPALIYVLIRALRPGPRRKSFIFIALFAIGWFVLFSVSAREFLHYAFPVFPLIAISIAMMLVALVNWVRHYVAAEAAIAAGLYLLIPILILADAGQLAMGMYSDTRRFFGPWSVTQLFLPAINAGRLNVVLYNFPERQSAWQSHDQLDLEAKEHFYLMHLPHAQRINSEAALATALEKPTLLILSKYNDLAALRDHFHLIQRNDGRFGLGSESLIAYAVDFDKLLSPHVAPPATDPSLSVDPPTPDTIRLQLSPAIRADVRIMLTAHMPTTKRVNFTPIVNGHHLEPERTYPTGGVQVIAFDISYSELTAVNDVVVHFDSPQNVAVTDAALDLFPRSIKRR
jgi:4-amino-4-deoxy-L-arabinose transferase-like glycosyltransferase